MASFLSEHSCHSTDGKNSIKRVALPRERFRDVPVPEIDSPTREAKGRDRPASVNVCSERAKRLPPTMTLRPDNDFVNFPAGSQ